LKIKQSYIKRKHKSAGMEMRQEIIKEKFPALKRMSF
jgi:hypothetical protein